MNPTARNHLSNPESWKRGAVMLLFFLLLAVITPLLMLVSLVGWVFLLVQGEVPESIRGFGRSLAAWYGQTARYLTGDARRRPFPFEDLDCMTDEPPRADARTSGGPGSQASKAAPATQGKPEEASPEPAASRQDQSPAPDEAGPNSEEVTPKKAVSKKPARKKAAKKKTVKKKADGKKAAGKTAPGKPANDPPASDVGQEH